MKHIFYKAIFILTSDLNNIFNEDFSRITRQLFPSREILPKVCVEELLSTGIFKIEIWTLWRLLYRDASPEKLQHHLCPDPVSGFLQSPIITRICTEIQPDGSSSVCSCTFLADIPAYVLNTIWKYASPQVNLSQTLSWENRWKIEIQPRKITAQKHMLCWGWTTERSFQ